MKTEEGENEKGPEMPAEQEGQELDGEAVFTVPAVPVKNEKDILELIKQENSWEQILYDVVAIENIDPWNLDLNVLATGFAEYIATIKELDFRIPAKWIIIACILLRIKSDYIRILKVEEKSHEEELTGLDELEELSEMGLIEEQPRLEVEPLDVIPRRKPVRQITIAELVDSLKKVIRTEERRDNRLEQRRGRIQISNEDITRRIDNLYNKIGEMLSAIREDEIRFSRLVGSWKRGEVVDTFLPLIHLDQEKKVQCRQESIFDEIFIKKREEIKKAKAG